MSDTTLYVQYQERKCGCSDPEYCNRVGIGTRTVRRPATRAEILAALGGEDVLWCEVHDSPDEADPRGTYPGRCWVAYAAELEGRDIGVCRFVTKRLVDTESSPVREVSQDLEVFE